MVGASYFSAMEDVQRPALKFAMQPSASGRVAKRWIWGLAVAFLVFPWLLYVASGVPPKESGVDWRIIMVSAVSAQSVQFFARLTRFATPIRLQNGYLLQRSLKVDWVEKVKLDRIRKVERFRAKRPVLMGIFAIGEGLRIHYNTYDTLDIELDTETFIAALKEHAPQAEFSV